MTVVIYITYDNLQKIEAERSLAVGVIEVELTNWTKTREPDEIGDGEKKLNSHVDLAGFNKNISASDVDSISDLYYEDRGKNLMLLREINNVTTVSNKENDTSNIDSTSKESSIEGNNIEENIETDTIKNEIDGTDNDIGANYDDTTNNISDNGFSEENDVGENNDSYKVESSDKVTSNDDERLNEDNNIKPSVTVNMAQEYSKEENTNINNEVNISDTEVENSTPSKVTGNKVLRTIINPTERGTIRYNLNTLYEYLKSDKPINWQDDKTTWDLYTSLGSEIDKPSMEWRMLSANVEISQEQYDLLKNNEAYAIFGIKTDNEYGYELVIPYNDLISIYINGNTTSINYQNRDTDRSYYLNGDNVKVKYKPTLLSRCKNQINHNTLCNHTDFHHIDSGLFNVINNKKVMDTDISKSLRMGENTIDFLVGNFISRESTLSNSCGFSKLNLYIIEKPKFNVDVKFYKYKGEETVYFDKDYMPTMGDEVYVRVDIENMSNSALHEFALNNIDLSININNKPLKINAQKITYNKNTITDKTRCYINDDFNKSYTVDTLKKLNKGDKVSIMSDKMTYTITKNDVAKRYVICEGELKTDYIRDDFSHIEFINGKKAIRIPVSGLCGTLNFTCAIEKNQTEQGSYGENTQELNNDNNVSFMINITSDNEFANLVIKPNQTYTVKNLNVKDTYNINLIVPQDYEVVDTDTYSSSTQNQVRIDTDDPTNYNVTIHIELKQKSNSYFYKNKQGKVDLSFK